MMWMRWSLPRLRIDQVMMTCLQYFLPISCVLLVGVCLWQLLVPSGVAIVVKYVLAFGTLRIRAGRCSRACSARRPMSAPRGAVARRLGRTIRRR